MDHKNKLSSWNKFLSKFVEEFPKSEIKQTDSELNSLELMYKTRKIRFVLCSLFFILSHNL